MVRDRRREAREALGIEKRSDHDDVGQVCAAADVGVIGDEDVALVDVAVEGGEKLGCAWPSSAEP
jgi:hypothetical protein